MRSDTTSELYASLRRMAIVSADTQIQLTPLAGGVSSDICRVDVPGSTFCVKRALPKLKVASDWHAPVERNRAEVAWLRRVGAMVPGHAPAILADDPVGGAFAMAWLPPAEFPTWKAVLRDGEVDAGIDLTIAQDGLPGGKFGGRQPRHREGAADGVVGKDRRRMPGHHRADSPQPRHFGAIAFDRGMPIGCDLQFR